MSTHINVMFTSRFPKIRTRKINQKCHSRKYVQAKINFNKVISTATTTINGNKTFF